MAFEVVWKQSRSSVTAKVPRMIRRGVHRVFAVFVRQGEVAEWSTQKNDWVPLAPSAVIRDKCLARPLPVAALLDAAQANAAVVQGLEAKGDPEIGRVRAEGKAEGRTEGKAEGKAEGLREAILRVLDARGLEISAETRSAVESCNELITLDRWLGKAATAQAAEDVVLD